MTDKQWFDYIADGGRKVRESLEPGQGVHYIPFDGCDPSLYENGVVKRMCDDGEHAFVVYHCAGEWDRFEDYTAARTHISQLRHGWVRGDQDK